MAATGFTPISLYYTATAAAVPTNTNLVAGELALNTTDGKLFYKDTGGTVQVLGTKGGVGSSTNTQVLYNSADLVVGSANLTFDGTVLSSTTVDITNLEVTNIKAKDGTASITLADTTGIATFNKATVISTSDATNAALRITQTGAGNAFVVEDAANPDASPFVIDPAGVVLAGFTTAPAGSYKAYISGTAFATGAWRVGDSTDGSTSGYISNVSNTSKSIQIAADPDNLGVNSLITFNIDGSEKARFSSTGNLLIGTATGSAAGIRNTWNPTGGTTAYGTLVNGTVQSDVTSAVNLLGTIANTAAATFNLTNLRHFAATANPFGAGSTVTNQYGFFANSDLSAATNNYGFYSAIASGTGEWNFYAAGTADNYFAGNLGLGVTPSAWAASAKAIEIGSLGGVYSGSNIGISLADNAYINAATVDIYKTTGFSTQYIQAFGEHKWFSAPSGTAGTAVPFTQVMGLNTSNNLFVGSTSGGAIVNTRINSRTVSAASTATLTPDIQSGDQFNLTAQAVALAVAAPIGTPVDGNKIMIRILDNGTARAITWNATYTVIGVTLPTTTVINKTTYVGCVYNANNTRWDVIAVTTQA